MQCPVCENKDVLNLIETWKEYKLYHCHKCDVVFSDPMKNPGTEWYEKSEMYAVGKIIQVELSWHHKQFLSDNDFYGSMLLDIGCGRGIFLNEAKRKGYKVWGIDFDKDNIKIAKERYGLENVYVMSVEKLSNKFLQEKFDIISFFEVLEHLDNLSQFIEQIKKILKPKGYIVLSVPNRDRTLDTLGEYDYPPNHLTKWNKNCLTSFLERSGFEVVKSVVKKLDAEDVSLYLKSKIRFGITKRLARRGIDANKQDNIYMAANLMRSKNLVFKVLALPVIPILSIPLLQGAGLYEVARLK